MQKWTGLKLLSPVIIDNLVNVEIDEVGMTCRVTADTATPPSAPTNLSFTALGNGIFLDWNDNPVSEKVTGYKVFRSTNQGGPFSSVGTPIASSFTDLTTSAGVSYWYHILATNSGGDSSYSEINAEFDSDTTAPGVPVITSTTQVGVNAVKIDWTPPSDADLKGFNVYRSTSALGTYTKLNTSGLITDPTFTDTVATAGSHWYYHVTSVDQTGNESASAATDFNVPASDTTPPAVPTGLVALDIHSAVRITWTPNTEPDLATYSIFRSDDGYTTALSAVLTTATYDDTTAVIGTPYTYKVLAKDTSTNTSAKSSASNSATRTAQPTVGNLTPFVNNGTMAPCVAHARGVRYTRYNVTGVDEVNDFDPLTNGDEMGARYEWNFAAGVNNSPDSYPTARGFNYAHVYEKPGQYTIQLERTDIGGVKKIYQSIVNISADTRRIVYCSSNGSSSNTNDGSDKTNPVNLGRANAILSGGNAIKVLLRRGDVFDITGTVLTLSKTQQMVSSISTFAKDAASTTVLPKLRWKSPTTSGFRYAISCTASSREAVIEFIDFDQNFTADDATRLNDVAIQYLGSQHLCRGCRFTKIGKPVEVDQVNRTTRWVLFQDCIVPNDDSMIFNFLFTKGQDIVFLGLKIVNSKVEHGIRISNCDRTCIAYCDITNKELSATDTSKTATNYQQGTFCYIYKNKLTADIGTIGSNFAGTCQIGPLNKATGHRAEFCLYCVMEENTINAMIEIEDGARYVVVRNNIITKKESFCFQIFGHGEGTDADGADYTTRVNHHIYIYNNTLIDPTKNGQILRVKHSFDDFEFSNNLLIGPLMVRNDSATIPNAAMAFNETTFGARNIISRNVIPSALDLIKKGSSFLSTGSFNQNGGSSNGVDAVTVDSAGKPTFTKGQQALARPVAKVFQSINGVTRLQSDASWTPGAYQL